MNVKGTSVSSGGVTISYLAVLNAIILETAYTSNKDWYWTLLLTLPLLMWELLRMVSVTRSSNRTKLKSKAHLNSLGALAGNHASAN